MTNEKKIPRPSLEQLRTFDELCGKTRDPQISDEQYQEVIDQVNDLITNYDWNNYIFTDPATGMKGVKNPAGEILVPADYESFSFQGDHSIFTMPHFAAMKDGKWGIVSADGANTVLCDFRFDYLQWYPFIACYIARWDGVQDKFGFVNKEGKVVISNVLTCLHEPWNDFMLLEGGGKFGAFDTSTFFFVQPEYERIDADPDELVVFHKDGVEGYVIEETGEFITKQQYEEDDKYADVYVYNTNINV